jgi:hypothetical protein
MKFRYLLGGAAGLLVLAVGTGLYMLDRRDKAGRAAVAEMCARDGGNTVDETVFASGFLTEVYNTDSCLLCIEAVGKGEFEYIDYEAQRTGDYIDDPGYHRVSLATKGDSRCESYLRAKEQRSYLPVPQDYGRAADQCYAIERLPSRPEGFVFSQQFRRAAAPNGYVLGVVETFIRAEPSGRTLAVNRDYLYTGATSELLAGPGGIVDSTCPTAGEWRMNHQKMLTTVLRDEAKKP